MEGLRILRNPHGPFPAAGAPGLSASGCFISPRPAIGDTPMEKLSREQLAGMAIVRREKAARAWAPPAALYRLRRLAADRAFTVRYLVAANMHTPQRVLDSLAADPHPMVAWAANRRAGSPPNCRRIPIAVVKSIMHQCVDDADGCEAFYQFALLGLFHIDSSGHVWRTGRLRERRRTDAFVRIEKREPEPCERISFGRYSTVSFAYRCLVMGTHTHRLVHRAFIGKMLDGYTVHHVDGKKQNNHPRNLKLMFGSDHCRYHCSNGPRKCVLSPDDVRKIRKLLARGESLKAIAQRYGVTKQAVSHIRTGRSWRNVK